MFMPENETDHIFDHITYGNGNRLAQSVLDGEIDPNLCRSDGVPLLNMAVMHNNPALVQALIHQGANINAQDRADGATALSIACIRGLPEIGDMLLGAGATPNLASHDDVTPLHILANSSHPSSLMMMRQLLIAGADPNVTAQDSKTPLHDAIEQKDWFKTKLLIHAGADVHRPYRGALAFQMIEASQALEDLGLLAGDASVFFRTERMLDKSLSEWRNSRVKNPDFPFVGL